jgi:transcriptional regulator with XRE-family HTH domain
MPRQTSPDLSIALLFLRLGQGWKQSELAAAAGVSPPLINVYESGRKKLTRERLEHFAALMGLPPETIDTTLTALAANRAAGRAPNGSAASPSPADRRIEAVAVQSGRMMADFVRPLLSLLTMEGKALQERQRADFLWRQLKGRTPQERQVLVKESRKYRSWALCERVAAESIEAAADSPDQALYLAGLAVQIAELSPGEEAWRQRLQGYAWAHVSNARRVSGDLPGADKALARAKKLWNDGASGDPGLLSEAVILGLEANLRRAQRRFSEALRRVNDALAADQGDLRGRLLYTKARILEGLDDLAGSTAALREASSVIDVRREPRLGLGVRFQLLVNLCLQGRASEAELKLGEVRELVERLGKELDLVRLVWLQGKLAAGLGRRHEARAAFEQVRRDFAARGLAYDFALVTLELSLVLLEEGSTEEVHTITAEMLWIFKGQGVHQEALAALQVFCDAAKQKTATVKLAQRVALYLHRAQHNPELQFEAEERTEAP